MKNLRHKIADSYIWAFLIQASIMFLIKLIFGLFLEKQIYWFEITITSVIYGLIMSIIMVNIYRKRKKN